MTQTKRKCLKGHFPIKRILSVGLAQVFLFTSLGVGHAAPRKSGFFRELSSSRSLSSPRPNLSSPRRRGSRTLNPRLRGDDRLGRGDDEIQIPPELGRIVDQQLFPNSKQLVLHIQDLHAHTEAQNNLAALIEHFYQQYGVTQVALEGSQGLINTALFQTIPDENIRQQWADEAIKRALITGPEKAAISNALPLTLTGVEDWAHYAEDFYYFQELHTIPVSITQKWDDWIEEVNQLEAKVFPAAWGHLKSQLEKAEGNQLFEILEKEIQHKGIDVETSYPVLAAYYKIKPLQGQINPEAYKKEMQTFLKQKAREGKDLSSFFLPNGENVIPAEAGIQYTQIRLVAQLQTLQEKLKLTELFAEVQKFQQDLAQHYLETQPQKELYQLTQQLHLIEKVFTAKASPPEWQSYQEQLSDLELVQLHTKFSQFASKANYSFNPINSKTLNSWQQVLKDAQAFYTVAETRNNSLIQNTVNLLDQHNSKQAVLVAGGFHTPGLTALLAKQNISYIVIAPKVTQPHNAELYLKRMLAQQLATDSETRLASVASRDKLRYSDRLRHPEQSEGSMSTNSNLAITHWMVEQGEGLTPKDVWIRLEEAAKLLHQLIDKAYEGNEVGRVRMLEHWIQAAKQPDIPAIFREILPKIKGAIDDNFKKQKLKIQIEQAIEEGRITFDTDDESLKEIVVQNLVEIMFERGYEFAPFQELNILFHKVAKNGSSLLITTLVMQDEVDVKLSHLLLEKVKENDWKDFLSTEIMHALDMLFQGNLNLIDWESASAESKLLHKIILETVEHLKFYSQRIEQSRDFFKDVGQEVERRKQEDPDAWLEWMLDSGHPGAAVIVPPIEEKINSWKPSDSWEERYRLRFQQLLLIREYNDSLLDELGQNKTLMGFLFMLGPGLAGMLSDGGLSEVTFPESNMAFLEKIRESWESSGLKKTAENLGITEGPDLLIQKIGEALGRSERGEEGPYEDLRVFVNRSLVQWNPLSLLMATVMREVSEINSPEDLYQKLLDQIQQRRQEVEEFPEDPKKKHALATLDRLQAEIEAESADLGAESDNPTSNSNITILETGYDSPPTAAKPWTNEDITELIEHLPQDAARGGGYMGIGGIHNLDIALHLDAEVIVIADMDKGVVALNIELLKMIEAFDPEQDLSKLHKELHNFLVRFKLIPQGSSFLRRYTNQGMAKGGRTPFYWLKDKEALKKIQQKIREDKIAFAHLDVTHSQYTESVNRYFERHGVKMDWANISNLESIRVIGGPIEKMNKLAQILHTSLGSAGGHPNTQVISSLLRSRAQDVEQEVRQYHGPEAQVLHIPEHATGTEYFRFAHVLRSLQETPYEIRDFDNSDSQTDLRTILKWESDEIQNLSYIKTLREDTYLKLIRRAGRSIIKAGVFPEAEELDVQSWVNQVESGDYQKFFSLLSKNRKGSLAESR